MPRYHSIILSVDFNSERFVMVWAITSQVRVGASAPDLLFRPLFWNNKYPNCLISVVHMLKIGHS